MKCNRIALITVCDDGDVAAWMTRHIYHALQDRREGNAQEFNSLATESADLNTDNIRSRSSQVREFWAENVSMSAWGIAVHTQARKIAISSNTTRIMVYSFALLPTDSTESDEEADYSVAPSLGLPRHFVRESATSGGFNSRRVNTRQILPETKGNIPCVSFCNTGDDPEGRFLIYGDIYGKTFLWDLLGAQLACEEYQSHYCSWWQGFCECVPRSRSYPFGVWGLYFLDPRSFRDVGDISVACDGDNIDLTFTVEHTPDSSPMFWVKAVGEMPQQSAETVQDLGLETDVEDSDDEDVVLFEADAVPPVFDKRAWDVRAGPK
jgi:hypothetical protein